MSDPVKSLSSVWCKFYHQCFKAERCKHTSAIYCGHNYASRLPHNEEFHNLYPSPKVTGVIKLRIRWRVYVLRMEDTWDVYRLAGKPVGMRPLRYEAVNWIKLAQNKVQWRIPVGTAMNILAPRCTRLYRPAAFLPFNFLCRTPSNWC
jgi:hypothetical protein